MSHLVVLLNSPLHEDSNDVGMSGGGSNPSPSILAMKITEMIFAQKDFAFKTDVVCSFTEAFPLQR